MKHNLANFPIANFTIRAGHKRKDEYIIAVSDWYEAFKKELEQLKQDNNCLRNLPSNNVYDAKNWIIDEILDIH